jgi:hypothetical protein
MAKKKKDKRMEQCFYGSNCQRKDCIYRHDAPPKQTKKTTEPCMAFLAGECSFPDCKKRHPGKAEAEKLVAKYRQTPCRFGSTCKTKGCLYIHEEASSSNVISETAFPPLPGQQPGPPKNEPTGAWKPAPPPQPAPPPPPPQAWYPDYANGAAIPQHYYYPQSYPPTNGFQPPPPPQPSSQYPRPQSQSEAALNVNAKEFVPGSH